MHDTTRSNHPHRAATLASRHPRVDAGSEVWAAARRLLTDHGDAERIPPRELDTFGLGVPGMPALASHIAGEVAASALAVVRDLPFFEAPPEVSAVLMLALASRIGEVIENDAVTRKRIWRVTPDSSLPRHITTTADRGPPHTDCSWFVDPPGLVLLFVERQVSEGGRTFVVRRDAVVRALRESKPDCEAYLRTVDLPFMPPVGYTTSRDVVFARVLTPHAIRWRFDLLRDGLGALPPVEARRAAIVLGSVNALIEALPVHTIRTTPGSLIAISNHQALHGREAFDPAKGERLLHRIRVRPHGPRAGVRGIPL